MCGLVIFLHQARRRRGGPRFREQPGAAAGGGAQVGRTGSAQTRNGHNVHGGFQNLDLNLWNDFFSVLFSHFLFVWV